MGRRCPPRGQRIASAAARVGPELGPSSRGGARRRCFSMVAVGDRRPPLHVLVAVGLVAGSTLALQVLLTRVFAAVLYYHFGFMAISLALLGVGAGAIMIYVRPAWFESDPLERALARWSALYAALMLVAVVLIVRLDYTLGDEITT